MGRFFVYMNVSNITFCTNLRIIFVQSDFFLKKLLTFGYPYVIINTVKGQPITITGQDEKGVKMDIMTDKQMEVILNLVADKFANCKNMEEVQQAIKDIKEMAKKNSPDK